MATFIEYVHAMTKPRAGDWMMPEYFLAWLRGDVDERGFPVVKKS